MAARRMFLTEKDARRLERHLRAAMMQNWLDAMTLRTLDLELQRVRLLTPQEPMPKVVTAGSCVRLRDQATGEVVEVTLTWPEEADPERGRISMISPVGAALLGHTAGAVVNLRTATGLRRISIDEVTWEVDEADGRNRDLEYVEASLHEGS